MNILKQTGGFIAGAAVMGAGAFALMPAQAQQTITPITSEIRANTLQEDVPVVISTPTVDVATTSIREINLHIANDEAGIARFQADLDKWQVLLDQSTQATNGLGTQQLNITP